VGFFAKGTSQQFEDKAETGEQKVVRGKLLQMPGHTSG